MGINLSELIYPYFVTAKIKGKEEIKNFPGVFRYSIRELLKDIEQITRLGIKKILLFGVSNEKDLRGKFAFSESSVITLAIKTIKEAFPQVTVMTDICLCAYLEHGHCGIIKVTRNQKPETGKQKIEDTEKDKVIIDNKKTLEVLGKMALAHARAGADWVAPSAMAKKQVVTIRKVLNAAGFSNVKILGYSAKFASSFYEPFRNAGNSAPAFGDRSSYQLDYTNALAAIREIKDDIKEGADMVMVKPALGYLDIIKTVKQKFNFPLTAPGHTGVTSAPLLAAYNVSGEYVMVKAYCQKLDARSQKTDLEKKMVIEIISGIKRAGADFIITYHAKDIARWSMQSSKL